jgi:UDP-N-acetylglucosamine--N-acetylmuramyl-(pentapeptide) pyrophosphoryl-undecaprenol N-acetylglucosamine transferase
MSRVLLVCGGTGGHLAPGIALAEQLAARGADCLLLVSGKGADARMAARYPTLAFRRGHGRGWGPGLRARLGFLLLGLVALADSLWLLLRRRPDAVVCFGGFLSLAPALVARLLRIPVHLHEANRVPGKAVRLLGRLATTVHLPAGVALAAVPAARLRAGGFPLRAEIGPRPREAARAALGFPPGGPLLLVMGGSQGAAVLTRWAEAVHPDLARRGVHLLCLSGPGGRSGERREGPSLARFLPFCDRMAEAYAAGDLAVSRAGAGTLAELAACRLPAVLVPLPTAADDHQSANARAAAAAGAARVCPEAELARLLPLVEALLDSPADLAALREGQGGVHAANRWDGLLQSVLADLPGARKEALA